MCNETRENAPPRFLRESFRRDAPCCFRRVPLDVLVDHILSRLPLADVLALRKADKAFYILTHEVTIWRNFFRQLDMPTPFVYEDPNRFTVDPREFGYERMVARSIMVEDNWRNSYTRARDVDILSIGVQVLEMKVLPGGNYMVASARSSGAYALMIWYLDQSPHITRKLLYCVQLQSRAYRLQARFMLISGKQRIVISAVTRRHASTANNYFDLDQTDYEDDYDFPMYYEWHAGSVTIAELEAAHERSKIVTQWDTISETRRVHDRRIDHFVLAMLDDVPVAAYIIQAANIAIYDLGSQAVKICDLDYVGPDSEVRGLRLFLAQRRALVILTQRQDPQHDNHYVHVYNYNGIHGAKLENSIHLSTRRRYSSFMISEAPEMMEHCSKTSPSSHLRPPISIFGIRENPQTLEHYAIWPHDWTAERPTYAVEKGSFYPTTRYIHDAFELPVGVLPGVHRPLVYKREPRNGSEFVVTNIRRYFPQSRQRRRLLYDGAHAFEREPLVPRKWHSLWHPTKMMNSVSLIPENVFGQLKKQESSCVGWDELSGRVCIATAPDLKLTVVDLACDVRRNPMLDIWKERERQEYYYDGNESMIVDDIGRPYLPYIYIERRVEGHV